MSAFSRGLDILTALQGAQGPLGYGELRRQVRIPPATFARLVNELIELDCLERCEGGYRLGLRCVGLALAARNDRPLQLAADEELRELVELTGESAELAEFAQGHFVFLDRRQSRQAVVLRAQIGSRFAIHPSNALGALAMAYGHSGSGQLDGEEAERIRRLRQAEMFQNRGEVYRVASALFDCPGRCIGCLTLAAPAYRATPERRETFLSVLQSHAQKVQCKLDSNLCLQKETQA
jgi:DNA-binding IclR family transcriptional regulator